MTDSNRRRLLVGLASTPALLGAPGLLRAQTTRPLTIVLTVPPGTSSDILARLVGERLRARLNRPVVVDSRSGGGGVVAVQHIKQMEADGSHLLLAPTSAISLLPLFSSKLPFDADKDLVAVCEAAAAPHAITVNSSSGIQNFAEYVDMVRKNPQKGSVGTPSPAGLASLLIHQIRKTLNIDVQVVPYRGGQPLLTDLLGGQIPASASIMPDYLNDHRAGKLRILAIASDKRTPLAPDLPTFAELGYPSFSAVTSFGFFARAGTPASLVSEYAAAITEALGVQALVERLRQMGLEPVGGTPAEFQRKVTGDRTRWSPLIQETGMRID